MDHTEHLDQLAQWLDEREKLFTTSGSGVARRVVLVQRKIVRAIRDLKASPLTDEESTRLDDLIRREAVRTPA